jgi:hypothetical protein
MKTTEDTEDAGENPKALSLGCARDDNEKNPPMAGFVFISLYSFIIAYRKG